MIAVPCTPCKSTLEPAGADQFWDPGELNSELRSRNDLEVIGMWPQWVGLLPT